MPARRKPAFKNLPASFQGRGIAILALSIVSALCFSLGFFVGRATISVPKAGIVAITAPDTERPAIERPAKTVTPVPEKAVQKEQEKPPAKKPAAEKPAPKPKTAIKKPVQPKPKPKPKPAVKKTEYSAQVGAFQNRKDAENMQMELISKGYKAYLYRTKTKDFKTMYKVRIGRFRTRAQAEQLVDKLKQTNSITAFVSRN